MTVDTLDIYDASNISYTASTCSPYRNGIKITNNDYIVSPFEIKPDDIITISSKYYSSNENGLDIEVKSRSISFKDLCTAIARQIVANDLSIENSEII